MLTIAPYSYALTGICLLQKSRFGNKTLLFVGLLLLIQLFSFTVKAQELFTPPPAKLLTSFRFTQFSGGVMVIRGCVGKYTDSLTFILDTGSGGISLDSSTVSKLGFTTEASDKTIRGIAGIRNVRFVYNQSLYLPGLRTDSLNFHINDYEILASVYGEQIDGIIGYSFFNRYIVAIDYDSLKLNVYSKGAMKYPKGGYLLRPLFVNIPIQGAELKEQNDINARFYFDTGAGLCLLLSNDFVNDSSLFSSRKKMVATQAEGLGGKAQMKLTTIKEFKLGPFKFKKVPTYIFEDEFNVTSYPYLGGLIGNDLLRRFNVILNYDRRDIYLTPNTHYRDLFDYAYTGLGIYMVNGQVVVVDVMRDSPAQDAGFREGDIILSIDNNVSQNIQIYKSMLQITGAKLSVVVMRDDGPEQLSIKVKNILKK